MPKLQVLYEDNHCIVVDKPNNLPVQADSQRGCGFIEPGQGICQGEI